MPPRISKNSVKLIRACCRLLFCLVSTAPTLAMPPQDTGVVRPRRPQGGTMPGMARCPDMSSRGDATPMVLLPAAQHGGPHAEAIVDRICACGGHGHVGVCPVDHAGNPRR